MDGTNAGNFLQGEGGGEGEDRETRGKKVGKKDGPLALTLNLFVVCFLEIPTRAALEAFKALLAEALVDATTIFVWEKVTSGDPPLLRRPIPVFSRRRPLLTKMSRSAIQHKLARQYREGVLPTSDPLQILDDLRVEPPPRGALELYGSARTLNLEPALLSSIASCPYFRDTLSTFESVEELMEHMGGGGLKHLEPWELTSPRRPSPAFCALVRLGTLRPTTRQVERCLEWGGGGAGVYVRCVAILLLRYAAPPEELWGWVEGSVVDETPVMAAAGPGGGGG